MSVLTHPTTSPGRLASEPGERMRSLLERLREVSGVRFGWVPAAESPAGARWAAEVRSGGRRDGWLVQEDPGGGSGALEAAATLAGEWLERQDDMARLVAEVRQREEQIDALARMSGSLSATSDSQQVCESLLDEAVRLLGARVASLRLRDHAGSEALCLTARSAGVSEEPAAGEECLEIPVQRARGSGESEELGTLTLRGKRDGSRFSAGDFRLAQSLALQAAVSLHHTRLLEEARRGERARRDLQIARDIQAAMLPGEDPRPVGIEVAGACVPSPDVGGDHYGYVVDQPGAIGLVVADVSGHGIDATVAMAGVRALLRAESLRIDSPAAALRATNRLLAQDLQPSGLFATTFLARYEESARCLRYAGAGHPPPLLWRASEGRFERLDRGGLALGIFEDVVYEEGEADLEPGDLVVIFSDGLTETRNLSGEFFSLERLCQTVMRHRRERPRTLMYRLLEAVEAFREGQPQRDDLTVMVVRSV